MLQPKAQAADVASQRPLKRAIDAEGGPAEDENEDSALQPAYVDRAAVRRAVHPSYSHATAVAVAAARAAAASERVVVAPAQSAMKPLPASNVGHSLLLKHGWTPGQALGAGDAGLVEPIEVTRSAAEGRRGLGMMLTQPPPLSSVAPSGRWAGNGNDKGDYREEGRSRRFAVQK